MTEADKPTPESERGDIMREHRPQNIEVDYGMLLARGQDAATRPSYGEVASFGFWAAVVVLLSVAVARC